MAEITKLFGGESDDVMILTITVPNDDIEITGSITSDDLNKPIEEIFKIILETIEATAKLKRFGVGIATPKKSSPIADFLNRTPAAAPIVPSNHEEDSSGQPARAPFRQGTTTIRTITVQKNGKQVDSFAQTAEQPNLDDTGNSQDSWPESGDDDESPYAQVEGAFGNDDAEPVPPPPRNVKKRAPVARPEHVPSDQKLDFGRVQQALKKTAQVEMADVNAISNIPTQVPRRIRDDLGTTTIDIKPVTNDAIKALDRRRGVNPDR